VHSHAHEHDVGARRLIIAVVINMLLTVAQVVGGVLSGSLSLIADALHNFTDANGLLLAVGARRIARRPADPNNTFGYARAEVVGGLINLTATIVIAVYLVVEAMTRVMDRPEIGGWTVVIVAGIALVIDAATAWITYSVSGESVNIRAAFVHNLADALASVAVVASGTLIILFDWRWTDLVATVGIAVYIVWVSWGPLRRCIRILMQSAPDDLSTDDVAATIAGVDGVEHVEHLHVWMLDESTKALEACLGVDAQATVAHAASICEAVRSALRERQGIDHAILEVRDAAHRRGDLIAKH